MILSMWWATNVATNVAEKCRFDLYFVNVVFDSLDSLDSR